MLNEVRLRGYVNKTPRMSVTKDKFPKTTFILNVKEDKMCGVCGLYNRIPIVIYGNVDKDIVTCNLGSIISVKGKIKTYCDCHESGWEVSAKPSNVKNLGKDTGEDELSSKPKRVSGDGLPF